MCDLVSIGLMLGSAYMKKKANDKVDDRQRSYVNAEGERQSQFQDKTNQSIADALEGFDPNKQTEQLGEVTDQRSQFLSDMVQETQPGSFDFGVDSSNEVVKTDLAKKLSETLSKGRDEAKRTASKGAFDSLGFDNSINLTGTGRNVNRMQNFSRGSSDVLGTEMRGALSAGDKYRTLGDIMSAASMVYGGYQATQPGMGMASAYPAGDAYGPSMAYYNL